MLPTINLAELQSSLIAFAPELVLCGGIIILLLLRMLPSLERVHLGYFSLFIVVAALVVSWIEWVNGEYDTRPVFAGMVTADALTVYMRLLLLGFTALVVVLTLLTNLPEREDSCDFHVLLLGGTLGMLLMCSATHLLMVYIAVEMASLPSYALAGFLKLRRQSSEAALKYVVYGGAASGVMLYGISLLAGRFGTGYLPEVAAGFAVAMQQGPVDAALLVGLLMIVIGLAFKLSAVPFHFWCPDVFEGAAAEVAGFLSVASKGAAVALTGRFTLALVGGLPNEWATYDMWQRVALYLGPTLALLAAITTTFGNLAAYAQTNLKRLLAYSTIAHAGYMLMALATLTREGLDAALFYLIAYLFMNLGAFAVVAFLRDLAGTEDLSGYSGMIQRAPVLTVTLAVFLLSLVGLPPLMGYMVKFQIFAALWKAYQDFNNIGLLVLLVIGLLNTVISLFYYVRVLKVMILDPAPGEAGPVRAPPGQIIFVTLLAAVVTVGIVAWDPLALHGSGRAVSQFRPIKPSGQPPTASAPAAAVTAR
ncbi:MAG: NADH-quinone oxidoreductase subunit N [Gemmatales bacterium]|nr:NADH-quinone oxidoreductase subunit N [Gemmatales bacterium]MDW8385537.1 NADH-quinone oxidoreductase subunit N [Gemmatales bacterium]